MCRLFAFVAPEQSTARRELGVAGVDSLLSLAQLHGDGWGWSGVTETGRTPVTHRSAHTAIGDPEFDALLSTEAHSAIVHLRWATAGLPVRECNAHPFQADGVSFAHNGTIKPLDLLHTLLPAESAQSLTGDTDSEMYFALIRDRLAQGLSLHEATAQTVALLRENFPLASLNALLLDREQLIVVHASATSVLTEHDLSRLAPWADALPSEHNEDYFALRWSQSPDGTITIGSTGVAGVGWQALPAESVTAIDLADRTVSTIELEAAAALYG